ncbi:MAG: hypothetical protein DHS20C11_36880 [Lysobacteraceae bacterium]|nr:MAG: hypothetical protein DHS20C11_36880 [Xanthomonadaceae bacterium]
MTAAMTPATMVRKTFPVGPLQCNCTVLGDSSTGKGYVFDPGGDPDLIMQAVAELGLTIHALIHTHAHREAMNNSNAALLDLKRAAARRIP